jgi:TolB protein
VEARVWDLKSKKLIMGRKYTGGASYVERIAHTLANDIVKYFTGKNGTFLSTILFVTEQAGTKEISAMDFDGRNVRQLTSHKSIAITPSGAGTRAAYTNYVRLYPQIWTMSLDGSDKKEVPTGVELNASPALSPDGGTIAFAGSARGNTDIYTVGVNGGSLRRLTTSRALEASPAWSPTGRQLLYTSDLTGTPQIYVMDAEGTNSRRVTYAGTGTTRPRSRRTARGSRSHAATRATSTSASWISRPARPSRSPPRDPTVIRRGRRTARRSCTPPAAELDADLLDGRNGQNKRQLTQGGNHTQPAWLP